MSTRYQVPGTATHLSDEGDWAAHIARGSPGGADFPDRAGTTMYPLRPGVVERVDNDPGDSGGRRVIVRHGPNERTEEMHAQKITATVGQEVDWDTPIGISGGSGFGRDNFYTPHIHVHGLRDDGTRFDVVPFMAFTTPAHAGGLTPIEEDDNDMKLIQHAKRGIAIIGPGYFKGLSGEELPIALDLYGGPTIYEGDAGLRQFDLARSIATNGIGPAATVNTVDLAQRLAEVLAPKLGTTAEEVLAILRPEFDRTNANIDDQPTEFEIVPKV